ncbi:synaptobrevin domain-containing protein [Phthorimaea operculella]|nr:synaptobrevin domain-containing protein [Phthorimaea operculella]
MEDQSGSSAPKVSDKRLAQTQAKVDEVVGIMRVNVEKVLERDSKLSELDNRADALQHGAAQFEQQAGKLKRKYWWQNLKMMLIIGAIGAVVLIIIIVTSFVAWTDGERRDKHKGEISAQGAYISREPTNASEARSAEEASATPWLGMSEKQSVGRVTPTESAVFEREAI